VKKFEISRRMMIRGVVAATATSSTAFAASPLQTRPCDFVLVHGAWHGAWCWRRVSERLLAAGHRVWVPTLTGLCDRAHLLSAQITLQTHTEDVVRLVQWEDLQSIVLVGHSYGGMVVTGAAEVLGDRVRSLVYLDAHIPYAGQSLVSMGGPGIEAALDKAAAVSDGLTLAPLPAKAFGVGEPDARWVDSKLTPHPYRTFKGVVTAVQNRDRIQKKTFVRARRFDNRVFDAQVRRYAGDVRWTVIELDEGHDLMITVPQQTADILLEASL
jgi:pimeloyl-ACP methyl ester carboxylesterase